MGLLLNNSKTLADMVDAVRFLVREDEDVFSDDDITRAVNAGLAAVYDVLEKQPTNIWTTTVAEQREYEIPETRKYKGIAIVDVVYLDGEPLIAGNWEPDDGTRGTPESWYLDKGVIGLVPTPDGGYQLSILYRKDFAPLSDDDDETPMTDLGVEAGLYYAAHLLKAVDEEYEAAQFMKGQFEEILGRTSTLDTGIYRDGTTYGSYGGAE